jgi:Zn-dependent protease with chaperone function
VNFFEHQDLARRRTTWLVALFLLAVLGVALTFYALAVLAMGLRQDEHGAAMPMAWWNAPLFVEVLGAVSLIIFLGAGAQRMHLGGSGRGVAEALGGRPLSGSTSDLDERKLIDVVQEMAIASGMPVPPIYVLEDEAINAFAAGNDPRSAVLGFTRGAIRRLDRDELQGVAGHEFSHIAHWDTRLNLRLACGVAGIMLIALIGRVTLQVAARVMRAPRLSKKDDRGAVLAIFAVGLALLIVGGIGAFFGRLLQAAISRQREFLADASAVQYTRNPGGIASALRRIGSLPFRPIQSTAASGLNHFFFAKSIHSWLSTHPPLAERIRRIEQTGFAQEVAGAPRASDTTRAERASSPDDASFAAASFAGSSPRASAFANRGADADVAPPGAHTPARADAAASLTRSRVLGAVQSGGVSSQAVASAQSVLRRVPPLLREAAGEPLDSQVVLLLLVAGADAPSRAKIRSIAQRQLGAATAACWDRLAPAATDLTDEVRLSLLDLCVPSLIRLSQPQYDAFRGALADAIRGDGRVDLFEWMMRAVLFRRVESRFAARPAPTGRFSIINCSRELRVVLGTLARAGGEAQARTAFERGAAACGLKGLSFPDASECTLDALHQALESLDSLAPRERDRLPSALAAAALSDEVCTTQELLLLRAFAARLDLAMPMP